MAGSSTQLSNGLPYMIFPMEMSTQLPFVDHGMKVPTFSGNFHCTQVESAATERVNQY